MIPKRSELATLYGPINLMGHPAWPDEWKWMRTYVVPEGLVPRMLCKLTEQGTVYARTIYAHRDLVPVLHQAFTNILDRNLQLKVRGFGGCFNIRTARGRDHLSAHAYGLAVDINPYQNPLGEPPNTEGMNSELVRCFTDAGFIWGGTFARPDCMHMQYLIDDTI